MGGGDLWEWKIIIKKNQGVSSEAVSREHKSGFILTVAIFNVSEHVAVCTVPDFKAGPANPPPLHPEIASRLTAASRCHGKEMDGYLASSLKY